jgi:CheY-like chemotaxis protein
MGSRPLGALAGVYALVVDDNVDARNIFQALLVYHGAFVVTSRSARDALRKLRQVKPDVVVCDVQLGDRDAMWLLGEARKRQATTPFIAVSGLDYDEPAMRASGFAAYLPKPVSHERLVQVILAAVDRKTLPRLP